MRLLVLPVVALLWLLPGCALADQFAGLGAPAGAPGDGTADGSGDGAGVVTAGCDTAAIVDASGQRCATCTFTALDDTAAPTSQDDSVICGAPVVAPCETRQNSLGTACQLCITMTGEILYDDCFTADSAAEDALTCETSPGATADEECRTCFDDAGNAVTADCGPRVDFCEDRFSAGRSCRVCTANGAVVSSTCTAPDLDPSHCIAYGDDAGRCIDCFFGEVLLSHECSAATADSILVCSQIVQPEGLVCTVCTDAWGTVVERSCEQALPQPERCAELVFSEQRCVVCVDENDVVVIAECKRNDCDAALLVCRVDADCPVDHACFDGSCMPVAGTGDSESPPVAECPAPPPCSNDFDDRGNLCRTCLRDDGVPETLCMPESRLSCATVPEDDLPEGGESLVAGDDRAEDQPSQGRLCTLCLDAPSGVEVYRDCEGNGAVPPPSCFEGVLIGESLCTVCLDAVSGTPVYRSCPQDTCAGMETAFLVDEGGGGFVFDGPIARIESATCEQCRQGDAVVTDGGVGGFQPRCIVDGPCTNALYGRDDSVPCPLTTRLVLAPLSCSQPWDAFGDGARIEDELRDVLEFLLRAGVYAVSVEQVAAGGPGCDSCSCERGDRIAVDVWMYDEARARAVLGEIVVP
jgi:hypothetical protein